MPVSSVSLATLTLALKDSANPQNKIPLDKFQGDDDEDKEYDFLDVANSILKQLDKKLVVLTALGHAAKIIELPKTDGRLIKGLVETGRSGTSQHILDTKTGTTPYTTKPEDVIMRPLYFLFSVPKNHHKAIILLERYRHSGLQVLLLDYLEREFKKKFPRFSFDIQYLTDTETFEQMLEGARVKEIRLTEHEWSTDRSDNTDTPREKKGALAVTYKPYRESGFEAIDTIKKLKARTMKIGNVLELPEGFLEPDEASFVIRRKGGKDRRISFADTSAIFRPYHDITDKIKEGDNGFPTFNSIDKVAVEILKEISQGFYEPDR